MRLVYIYHSGFALEADGFSILIDYFKDSDPDPAKGTLEACGHIIYISVAFPSGSF